MAIFNHQLFFAIPFFIGFILSIPWSFLLSEPPGSTQASNSSDSFKGDENEEILRFAVIGDYGTGYSNEARVASLVTGWAPDFIITTGDNNYPDGSAETIDRNIGQFYSQYIGDYQGSYGLGSETNRFWPSLGNHDWLSISCDSNHCNGPYFDYFNLPGNERYYDVDFDLVHLYVMDSFYKEPDGNEGDSIQANWLKNVLSASQACFDIVYFHHAPYSSGHYGSYSNMQWPFHEWGAEVIMAGHDHSYERLAFNGLPYFVNGTGGAVLYSFENLGNLPPGVVSHVRYNETYGAMLVTATDTQITYEFINVDGEIIDTYTTHKDCSIPVNQAPTINGTQAAQTVDDMSTIEPFSSVTISDLDSVAITVTVSMDDPAKGDLINLGNFVEIPDGSYIFNGTPEDATADINTLTFDPTQDRMPVGDTETTTFTISADDGIADPVTDDITTVIVTVVEKLILYLPVILHG